MSFQRNNTGEKELRKAAAMALLRIATAFQANEKAEWQQGFPNSPRSSPGEHLKAETWNARDNLVYTPDDPATVAKTLEVYVGYRKAAWYAADWERRQDSERRRGLPDKLQEFMNAGLPQNIFGEYVG